MNVTYEDATCFKFLTQCVSSSYLPFCFLCSVFFPPLLVLQALSEKKEKKILVFCLCGLRIGILEFQYQLQNLVKICLFLAAFQN